MNKTNQKALEYTFHSFLIKDSGGQISMDYIAGIVIFMLAFIFLFQTLSTLFIPFQSNSDEIKSMSDRVAMVLVESTDGLASSPVEPNIISLTRARVLNDMMNDSSNYSYSPSYDSVIKTLGLYSETTDYNLNVSLTYINNSVYMLDGKPVLYNGPVMPQDVNVAQTIRLVYIEQTGDIAKLFVRVW